MKHQRGFGLIGILITLVIIVGIAGTSFYTLQNIGKVDTLDGEGEKQGINSAIQQAEDVKQQMPTIIGNEGMGVSAAEEERLIEQSISEGNYSLARAAGKAVNDAELRLIALPEKARRAGITIPEDDLAESYNLFYQSWEALRNGEWEEAKRLANESITAIEKVEDTIFNR
jgi:hypothetical protein